jgi:hypothetical protein
LRPSWSLAQATWTSPWVSTPTVTLIGSAYAMVVMAVSLPDKGGWLGARTALRRVWLHRLLLGHARSAGTARGWPRRRIDRSRQRHKASETTGQTRAAATTRIMAVKGARPPPVPSADYALHNIITGQRPCQLEVTWDYAWQCEAWFLADLWHGTLRSHLWHECRHPHPGSPRPPATGTSGALLSADDFGVRGERDRGRHPLWQSRCGVAADAVRGLDGRAARR